jgi:tetratricopeptide (TPR) repeat protein
VKGLPTILTIILALAGPVRAAETAPLIAEARAALAAKDVVKAMSAYSKVLELEPSHAVAAYERGMLLMMIGEPDNAIADFTTAALADPHNGRALARRGSAKIMLRNRSGAAEDFDLAVAAAPDDYEVYVLRATFRLQMADVGAAREDLEAAIRLAGPEQAAKLQSLLDRLPGP